MDGVAGGRSSSSSARPLQIHISDGDNVPDHADEVRLEESFDAEGDVMIEAGLMQGGFDDDSD